MVSQNMKIFILVLFFTSYVEGGLRPDVFNKFSNQVAATNGTKWALLIAGSNGFSNYRHQADVCHAYQILKNGGLKDENIIVFMYDDIAFDIENPKPGVIINNPKGKNVYPGVPKDYTGDNLNASNIFAAILGNKKDIRGGSGKVLNTSANDHIFIFYSDHGGPGTLGMPNDEIILAKDFVNVLKRKHASNSYESMVIYVESCESGSVFDGLLSENLNIYVTTASDPNESSYACYCDGIEGYEGVCVGDLYSVSWMEDSEQHDPTKETLKQQYTAVKKRTGEGNLSSHVMQYGDLSLSNELVGSYIGLNFTGKRIGQLTSAFRNTNSFAAIEQRLADLFYLAQKVKKSEKGTKERIIAQKKLDEEIFHRQHVDKCVAFIGQVLFKGHNGPISHNTIRPPGQSLVDDWDCFKSMVVTYENICGPLRIYGRKYLRTFANMCNAGFRRDQLAQVAAQVCSV